MNKKTVNWALFSVRTLLTLGASLTLGLLSFGGFYAIYPSVALGLASFGLATLYEGEIYNSNLADALKKLFKPNYFKLEKAKELLESLIDNVSEVAEDIPAFFKDYQQKKAEFDRLSALENPNKANKKQLKQVKKELKAMQRYFALALFDELPFEQEYAIELKNYLKNIDNGKFQKEAIEQTAKKKGLIKLGLLFSSLTAALFSLGSIYLILETLSTLTFLSLPFGAVVSLAVLCGTAYGFLIYNSISDMIWNETLNHWFNEVKQTIQEETSLTKTIAMTTVSALLVALGVTLTIFTAGTWWTIAKHTKNLPPILRQIPQWVTAVLIPTITGLAALVFTLENTKGSVDTVMAIFSKQPTEKANNDTPQDTKTKLPFHQRINLFDFLIYITEVPLRVLGFVLHIGSIGVTTDRIPGVHPIISVTSSMISEGFEDLRYFVKGEANPENAQEKDLPTRLVQFVLSPLYIGSVIWNWLGSKFTQHPLPFGDAWDIRFHGSVRSEESQTEQCIVENKPTSVAWQQQKLLMQLTNEQKRLQGTRKQQTITTIKERISEVDSQQEDAQKTMLNQLEDKDHNVALSEHRHWFHVPSTATHSVEELETMSQSLRLNGG